MVYRTAECWGMFSGLPLSSFLSYQDNSSQLADIGVAISCKAFTFIFTFRGHHFLHFSIGFALVLFTLSIDIENSPSESSTIKLLIYRDFILQSLQLSRLVNHITFLDYFES